MLTKQRRHNREFREVFARFSRSFREVFASFSKLRGFGDVLGPVRICSDAFGRVQKRSGAFRRFLIFSHFQLKKSRKN